MRPFFFLTLFVGLIALSGCVTPTTVDFDRDALPLMRGYQSFAVDSRTQRSNYQDVLLSPIVDRRIERQLEASLRAKGFVADERPDFRVTFNTVTKTRTELNHFGPPPYRRFPYHGYGGRYLDFQEYEEGTFVIDIIDAKTKQLVWRGAYARRLGWSAPDDAEVRTIVETILHQFPPQAANAD